MKPNELDTVEWPPNSSIYFAKDIPMNPYEAMNHERIKFRILQDGTVEETVEGINGSSCEKITEELEEKLGNLHHRIHTSDYYKQEVENVAFQHNQN